MNRKKISPANQIKPAKPARRSPANRQQQQQQQKGVSLSWSYRLLTLVCGTLLIGGIFVGARHHFSSIDVSIKNSRLRKQSEELLADKRRLLLTKEIALSPSEITKAAQKIGFTAMTTASNVVAAAVRPAIGKTEKLSAEKPSAGQQPQPKQPIESKAQAPQTDAKAAVKTTKDDNPAADTKTKPDAKIKKEMAR